MGLPLRVSGTAASPNAEVPEPGRTRSDASVFCGTGGPPETVQMADEIEKFTIENINGISLTLLENPDLKRKHLDNLLLFIVGAFENEAECLAKLKVLNKKRKKKIDCESESVVRQIFLTVLSIKDVEIVGEIERMSLSLLMDCEKNFFVKIVKWYFLREEASKGFAGKICAEILRIKNVKCIKSEAIGSEEEGEGGKSVAPGAGEDDFVDANELRKAGGGGLDAFFSKKRQKKDTEVAFRRLIGLLKIVVKKNQSRIRDFYPIMSLMRIRDAKIKEIVDFYVKRLRVDERVLGLFFEGLRLSPKMIFVFPQIYNRAENFDWQEFVDILKSRKLELECLRFVKVPASAFKEILGGVKIDPGIAKAQIKKMEIGELRLLGTPRDRKVSAAIDARIANLESKAAESTREGAL